VVEKVIGWPAGGQALLGMRAVGWVHSVGTVGNIGSGGKGRPCGVVGTVQWGAATGRVQAWCRWCLAWLGVLGRLAGWWPGKILCKEGVGAKGYLCPCEGDEPGSGMW